MHDRQRSRRLAGAIVVESLVDPSPPHSVELLLARSGGDLVMAVAAAQFARIVDRSTPGNPAEMAAIESFAELFAGAAESWGDLAAVERAALVARLGDQLERLEGLGWFVHWGRVELALARPEGALQLPAAVLAISRSGAPTRRVTIPGALDLNSGRGALH